MHFLLQYSSEALIYTGSSAGEMVYTVFHNYFDYVNISGYFPWTLEKQC
jgi:hypothetical protein